MATKKKAVKKKATPKKAAPKKTAKKKATKSRRAEPFTGLNNGQKVKLKKRMAS
ncbi:MAG: hypothetical protein GY714_18000 [Desulfobacterales bacterium]|nr:hypothetical protein [Desulfobacterales bacterium]